jgi:hypothetical protein
MAPDLGAFPMHDPIKNQDCRIDYFILGHDEVRELTLDELIAM